MSKRASAVTGPAATGVSPASGDQSVSRSGPAVVGRDASASPFASPLATAFFGPGVALFRRLRFPAKAAVISLCFALPIATLLVLLSGSMAANIEFAMKERQGVAVMQRLAPALQGILATRNATRAMLGGHAAQADYRQARQTTDAALQTLQQYLQDSGDALALLPTVTELQRRWQATAEVPNGADAQGRTVFGPVSAALVDLLQHVGDDSNLVLDPDVDSFYTINALVLTLPRLAEDLGQVWGWSTYAAAKGDFGSADARNRFIGWTASAAVYARDLRGHLQRAAKANPALASALDAQPLQGALAYVAEAESATRNPAGRTPASLYDGGRQALQQLFTLYHQGLPALDSLLAQRIERLALERRVAFAVVAAGLLVAAYLMLCFYRVMDGGVRQLTGHIEAMRDGHLGGRMQPEGRDEIAQLMAALEQMRQSLQGIVLVVRQAALALQHNAEQVSGGAGDLSGRTEANAAALEQTAASMEQIAATVKQSADASRDAARLAHDNAATAGQGGAMVAEVVTTMDAVRNASARIADIVGVIDGLAFRTNILALNAAVEAARAGDQGKGFAVVAAEVRALAQRSAQAAREIRGLIGGSVDTVAQCTERVQAAGVTMEQVVRNAERIKQLLAEISGGAAEQSAGVAHIGSALQELDGSTQHNARLVHDTAATAAEMRLQAQRLSEGVARFSV